MRSDTDSGTARLPSGFEPQLNERAIAIRHLATLRAIRSAPLFAGNSLSQRHCAYQGGWS
jgi:hypothetical protein